MIKIKKIERGYMMIDAALGKENNFMRLNQLPGFKKWVGRKLKFRPVSSNIQYIHENWPNAEWIDDAKKILDDHLKNVEFALENLENKRKVLEDDGSYEYKTTPYDHQRQAFLLSRDSKWFALLAEMGCVDSETECLGENGWFKISEYSGGKVMQYDPYTGNADFVEPIATIKKPCSRMIHFTSNDVDQMVSIDHRMILVTDPYSKLIEDKENFVGRKYYRKFNHYDNKMMIETTGFQLLKALDKKTRTRLYSENKFFYENENSLPLNDEEIKFYAAIVFFDNVFVNENSGNISVKINKKEKYHRAIFERLLCTCEKKYIISHMSKNQVTYIIQNAKLEFVSQDFSGFWWRVNRYQMARIEDIFTELFDNKKYLTCSYQFNKKINADFFQFILASNNRHSILEKKENKKHGEHYVVRRIRHKNMHELSLYKHGNVVDSTDGFMYCFSVPTECLVFRRNGKIFISGNTGKTKILIDNAAYLYSKNKIDTLIVIAPNGVHRNWIDNELPIHLPDWCVHNKDFYSSKHGKKRMNQIYDMVMDKNKLNIIAFNIEGFTSKKAQDLFSNIVDNRQCMIVLDESTTIKSPSAKRTKFLISMSKNAPYKRIANGAPITKGIEDLYSQFGFLNYDIIGYDSFTTFKNQYCEEVSMKIDRNDPSSAEYKRIVDYKNVDELIQKIEPYSFRILKKDCLDLPEKVYKIWPIEMTNEQKNAYVELKKEFSTMINNSVVEAELALVRLLRLQQITCGWYPNENGEMVPFPGKNPRMEALKDICREVEESGQKAIIWSRFKADIYAIEKMLGDKAVSYHGDVDQESRKLAGERFQNDDSVRYMIAMLSSNSGAVRGHTWTAASVTIYYSNIFDLDPRCQSEDRMHRIGMGDSALYIDLMALGTVDRKIIGALRAKKNIADLITQDGPTGFLDFINEEEN